MSPSGRFLLAVVYGWSSLIGIARSFDTDPSAFFMDDLSFSPTDFSNPGDLSSDLFSAFDPDPLFDQDQGNFDFNLGPADTISTDPISADFDSQLWNWGDDSDLSAAFDEASCVGADGQPIEKMRLRRETGKSCPSPSSAGSTPQLPTFQQIEETVEGGAQNKPGAKVGDGTADDDSECPAPYRRHVCCTGPGLQTFRQSGIYDAVQGCEPWIGACQQGTHDFCCKAVGNIPRMSGVQGDLRLGYLSNAGSACVLWINIGLIGHTIF